MNYFKESDFKKLYIPDPVSHKGQNGKVLIIAGSVLFHAASIWALDIASKLVDMVFYASVPENNAIVKGKWRNGIIVPRDRLDQYVDEADAILIGPGLPRESGLEKGDDDTKILTESLFKKHPDKQWIIDGGSLQVIRPEILPKNSIVTPHRGEFETLFNVKFQMSNIQYQMTQVQELAKKYQVTILLKGPKDIVCSPSGECVEVQGGNAGMTKGGTGDVLAGLTTALASKNEPFLAAICASYINKKAGESLEKKVGLYFNASDLVEEIPVVMKQLLQDNF